MLNLNAGPKAFQKYIDRATGEPGKTRTTTKRVWFLLIEIGIETMSRRAKEECRNEFFSQGKTSVFYPACPEPDIHVQEDPRDAGAGGPVDSFF